MENNEQDTSLEANGPTLPSSLVTPTPPAAPDGVNPAPAAPAPQAPALPGTPLPSAPPPQGPILPGTPAPSAPPPPPQKPPFIRRLLARINIYSLLFVLVLIVAGGVIYLTLNTGKSNNNNSPQVSSLTDAEISTLKGSTTIVGTSKQTLDVQSPSIFEGQILARSDLDVAGNIKVGGSLSLPSLSVTGNTTLAGLTVGQGLNVAGALDVQGQLTLHKGLSVSGSTSFGNLSAASLSVTSLQLSGDLGLNRHIVTSGNTPGKSSGSALGSGGTASVSGDDTAGTVNINTGSSPATGCFITVSFAHKFSATPSVMLTPVGSAAGALSYYVNRSTSSFSVCTASTPSSGKSFAFDYFVVE